LLGLRSKGASESTSSSSNPRQDCHLYDPQGNGLAQFATSKSKCGSNTQYTIKYKNGGYCCVYDTYYKSDLNYACSNEQGGQGVYQSANTAVLKCVSSSQHISWKAIRADRVPGKSPIYLCCQY